MMPGCNLTLVSPKACFAATQWRLISEQPAPPGWLEARTFAYNVRSMAKLTDRAISTSREGLVD